MAFLLGSLHAGLAAASASRRVKTRRKVSNLAAFIAGIPDRQGPILGRGNARLREARAGAARPAPFVPYHGA
ncbi:hypothetical protein GCM10027430_24400 [Lysobacter tyrosinilyticus]